MKTKLLFIWDHLKTSFWFFPLVLIVLAIVLAIAFVYLDSQFSYKPVGVVGYFFLGGVESARTILSTIAGAMLGVAGTVFSITLVTLTLASSQFGSRLLRNFMHDRLNQVVLGTYIATFVYCLLVLRTVVSSTEMEFVPNISVLAAIFLSIANILLLVLFIHHVAIGIQADQVISDISINLKRSIDQLFPEHIGESNDRNVEKNIEDLKQERQVTIDVKNIKSGYLQAIDSDIIMSLAKAHDLLITLHFRPGDFIVLNEILLTINSHREVPLNLHDKLIKGFIIKDKRTPIQDAEFAVHQLVEVASRALSPGINDPFTAITCIDKLTETMCLLTRRAFPSAYRLDSSGQILVVTSPLTFQGMMDASFNQIRQYGKEMPAILVHLLESFHKINFFIDSKSGSHADSLKNHASMVLYTATHANLHPNDLSDVQERFDRLAITNL